MSRIEDHGDTLAGAMLPLPSQDATPMAEVPVFTRPPDGTALTDELRGARDLLGDEGVITPAPPPTGNA